MEAGIESSPRSEKIFRELPMKITGRIIKVEPFRLLFQAGHRKVWLPRQEIRNLTEIRQRPENTRFPERIPVHQPVTLSLPRWLAERKFSSGDKQMPKKEDGPCPTPRTNIV